MARNKSNRRQDSAVGYVRRSTDKQEQSIGDQKKEIESYVQEHSLRLLKFYIDDAISGTSVTKRLAFQQMVKDAESSNCRFSYIIVYDVKRFGRLDNDEAGYYRHRLKTHGVEVLYINENFNGDYTDDLLRPVKQWQARQESKDLSKVTIRGLLSKVEGGWWMGGTPPYGYDLRYQNAEGKFLFKLRFMPDGSKQLLDEKNNLIRKLARGESLNISKRDQAKLTLSEPKRVKIIKQIFQMYAVQGKGYKSLTDTLNQQGIPTPRGPRWSHIYSGHWTTSTVRAILVNPIYSGDMVWNRRTDARFHRISKGQAVDRKGVHGARLVPNSKTDWIIVRDAHPPLISRRLLEQAKQRLENHPKSIEQKKRVHHGKTWSGQRSRFVLSGLMKCSLCGNRYQGVTRIKGKKRNDGTRVKTYYYGCGGYITKGTSICRMNAIPKAVLESKVIETVLDFYSSYLEKGGRHKLAEAVKAQTKAEKEDITSARKRAQAKLENITKVINNLLDNITETNRDHVDRRLNELTTQKQQIETRLEELERLSLSQAEIDTIVNEGMQFLASLEFTLDNSLPQEKLTAIRQCVEKIGINKPVGEITLAIRTAPIHNLPATQELRFSV
ncbi:MAG: hypothetical protein FVQ85_11610 [Planctomycetes bacterium]|nr:hypothetical protein [Planctomycetota bacterium]